MAVLEDLITRVSDQSLRGQIEAALADLKRRKRFGLVFEEHIPETLALFGLPVQVGATVQRRKSPNGGKPYRVTSIDAQGTATIEPIDGLSEPEQAPTCELLVVKRFGEPIYPALMSVGSVKRGGDTKPNHAVINGENFHALQLFTYLYEGQVDCIYIDPPYNTGARDWKYNNHYVDSNDSWRHSKWLSMMDKRLRLARRLLTSDGVLVVTVDENEHAHLTMLLELIFRDHDLTSVAIVHNPRGIQGDNFSYTNEFAIFVTPHGRKVIADRPLSEKDQRGSNLRNWGGESERHHAANCFYPIYVEGGRILGFGDVAPAEVHPAANEPQPDGSVAVWPIDQMRVERKWRYARQSVESIRDQLSVRKGRNGDLQVQLTKTEGAYKTVWQDPKYDASTHGTQLIGDMIGVKFPFPKSLYAVREVLYAITARKPDALILDFFAGSGTTLHATCLLNAEDGGRRKCILVTNNEVEEPVVRRLGREGYFRGDPEYEKHGIFEQITRPRCEAAITGLRSNGEALAGTYETAEGRPLADGFEENIGFFRLNYLDADEVDLGRQFAAIAPSLWLAAGGVGSWEEADPGSGFSLPPGTTYGVLFRESRFRQFKEALAQRPDVTHVWLVTDSEEAFAEMRAALGGALSVSMLYRDYLRNFRINTEQNL